MIIKRRSRPLLGTRLEKDRAIRKAHESARKLVAVIAECARIGASDSVRRWPISSPRLASVQSAENTPATAV